MLTKWRRLISWANIPLAPRFHALALPAPNVFRCRILRFAAKALSKLYIFLLLNKCRNLGKNVSIWIEIIKYDDKFLGDPAFIHTYANKHYQRKYMHCISTIWMGNGKSMLVCQVFRMALVWNYVSIIQNVCLFLFCVAI